MRRFLLRALLGASALGLTMMATPDSAAAQCGVTECQSSIGVSAQVIARIELTKIRDLDFGVVFRGTPKSVAFTDLGAGVGIDRPSAALIKVTGEPAFDVKYSWEGVPSFLAFEGVASPAANEQLPVSLQYCITATESPAGCSALALTSGNGESSVQTFPSAVSPSETGEQHVHFRGTATPSTTLKLGVYTGSFVIRAEYVGL